MTSALILNLAFSAFIAVLVIGVVVAAILTQHHDRGVHVVQRTQRRAHPPKPTFGALTRRRAWPAG
jgi:hypothetical protein